MSLMLGPYPIASDQPPVIIAEMSGNHNQSLARAMDIVRAAADAGAHAIKLQTYTADTMTIDSDLADFVIRDPKSLWNGRKLYELYKEAATPWEWHAPLFDLARKLKIVPISTPFDESAVDFLQSLGAEFYKVASFEMTDLPLIRKIASTNKPMVVSTGMATQAEIEETVQVLRMCGCEDFVLLKCTSTYPASPENTNIMTIPEMSRVFQCPVGLSDHTMGIGVAVASVALGARVIEKHFTLRRADGGVDSAFSLEPGELRSLVEESRRAFLSLGRVQIGPTQAEKNSLQFRRSIYVVKDVRAGELLTKENVRIIRPGFGLAPKFFDQVLGRRAKGPLSRGTPLNLEMTEPF